MVTSVLGTAVFVEYFGDGEGARVGVPRGSEFREAIINDRARFVLRSI